MISLLTRLLVAAAVTSLTFLSITGVLFDNRYSNQVKESIYKRIGDFSKEIYYTYIEEWNKNNTSDLPQNESTLAPTVPNGLQDARKEMATGQNNTTTPTQSAPAQPLKPNNKSTPANPASSQTQPHGVDVEEKKKEFASKQVLGKLKDDFVLRVDDFRKANSGLYAKIATPDHHTLWRSGSLKTLRKRPGSPKVPFNSTPNPGDFSRAILRDDHGNRYFTINYSIVTVEQVNNKTVRQHYLFQVSEAFYRDYDKQMSGFRKRLIQLSAGLTVTLLVTLVLVLKWWGLGPLRQVAKELDAVKSGKSHNITGIYPKELAGLTDGIKTLIVSERAQQERYRNSLGDLAHSLKTPLAVLASTSENQVAHPSEIAGTLREQVSRMRQIVDYQLQRAAASGRTTLMTPIQVKTAADRIVNTLKKVYAEKSILFEIDIEDDAMFIGDEGDLLELCGNILDNACKLCQKRVRVSASMKVLDDNSVLQIDVEDDGPGIDEDKILGVLKRGFRADESHAGQGIGLAVVKEIIHAYQGKLSISQSDLGGAKFTVEF